MLETVDLTLTTPKDVYKEERERLVAELSVLQQQCLRENIGSIISFDGWDAAGKGSRISNLVSELDARSLTTWSIHKPVGDEARKPFMERFWSKVGRHGTMTIFDQSWYSRAVHMLLENDPDLRREKRSEELGRILEDAEDPYGDPSNRESEEILRSITSFEHQFASDGYVIIKFFLHISKKEQKKRLDKLAASDDTSWRVGKEDYRRNRRYDDLAELVDMFLEKTDYVYAPWTVVPATDWRTANLVILRTIIAALKKALARKETEKLISPAETAALSRAAHADTVISRFPLLRVPSLDDVTYDNTITNEDYQRELDEQQDRLTSNALQLYRKRIPVMIAYEGWDAAGKGGNIKRVARALDARDYRIYPSSAPTPEEKEHPFLWRYWTRLPKTGHFGIYDRI